MPLAYLPPSLLQTRMRTPKLLSTKRAFLLSKVRISGGGRCNVTHACFDPKTFAKVIPRGSRELLGPFNQFQASDTIEWFESRGVVLKTEADGRMFPTTDSSQTIIDCLLKECRNAGVALQTYSGIVGVNRNPDGRFELEFGDGRNDVVDRLLIACGGLKSGKLHGSLEGLGIRSNQRFRHYSPSISRFPG